MRSITELFEFLSNCTKETILPELNDHCNHLVQKNTCMLIYRNPAFLFTEFLHPYLPISCILICRNLALLFTVYTM